MAVYMDYNATTPLDPRVRDTMTPWLEEKFGNASSREYEWGWEAAEAIELARRDVSDFAGAVSHEVVFLSGATEALNTVLRSYVGFEGWSHKKIITCATEHDAVLAPAAYLCRNSGVELEILPVDSVGRIDLARLEQALRLRRGALMVAMFANNEIGTVHPVADIAAIVHAADGTLLCDATQAFGKLPLDLTQLDADFVTLSAHKICGPKGVGALLVKRDPGTPLEPLIMGGGQERGGRGGTLNVPAIVGFGEACRIAGLERATEAQRVGELRDYLEDAIFSRVDRTWGNGNRADRLKGTSNIGFSGVNARTLIRDMHDIAVSTRSACSSGDDAPSHVLRAIGLSDDDAASCIRFSLGRFTTRAQVEYAVEKVIRSVHRLRTLA